MATLEYAFSNWNLVHNFLKAEERTQVFTGVKRFESIFIALSKYKTKADNYIIMININNDALKVKTFKNFSLAENVNMQVIPTYIN